MRLCPIVQGDSRGIPLWVISVAIEYNAAPPNSAAKEHILGYSGIFLVTNKCSGKQFVGQSSNLYKRWRDLLAKASRDPSSNLECDIADLGADNFDFQVVEYAHPTLLDSKQKKYITMFDTLEPNGYNRKSGYGR